MKYNMKREVSCAVLNDKGRDNNGNRRGYLRLYPANPCAGIHKVSTKKVPQAYAVKISPRYQVSYTIGG
jgi:hypothetical protein